MTREEYIKMRKLGLIALITFKYFKEKGLKMTDIEFGNNYYKIMKVLNIRYKFSQAMMISELDGRFELTITEDIATGKIYKIT